MLGALIVGLTVSSSSGDWESEESYVADMKDSYTRIGNIEGNIADTIYAYENDSYTLSGEVADELALGRSSLQTHIDYFEDSTPPWGYGGYQENTLEAWESFDEALEVLEEGYYYRDQRSINEGFSMVNGFYGLAEDTKDHLPDTESAESLENMMLRDGATF